MIASITQLPHNEPQSADNSLESVAADISLALTFIAAADRFGDDVRELIAERGGNATALVLADLKRTDTLLDEARLKLEASLAKLDRALAIEYAAPPPPALAS